MSGLFQPSDLIPRHLIRWRVHKGGGRRHAVRILERGRLEPVPLCGRESIFSPGMAPDDMPECKACAKLVEPIPTGPRAA